MKRYSAPDGYVPSENGALYFSKEADKLIKSKDARIAELERLLDVESRALAAANERADSAAKWEAEANRLGERVAEMEGQVKRLGGMVACSQPLNRIAELEKALSDILGYFRSGNGVPVERATIRAEAPEIVFAKSVL